MGDEKYEKKSFWDGKQKFSTNFELIVLIRQSRSYLEDAE